MWVIKGGEVEMRIVGCLDLKLWKGCSIGNDKFRLGLRERVVEVGEGLRIWDVGVLGEVFWWILILLRNCTIFFEGRLYLVSLRRLM